MDVLADLLAEVRSSGALFGRSILTAPWSIRFADGVPLTMVSMLRGQGWVVPDGADPVRLAETDVAIVVGPEPFTVADSADATAVPFFVMYGPGRCRAADGTEFSEDLVLGVRTWGERLDGPNVLLTGSYQVRGRVCDRLVCALPRVLVVPNSGRLCPVLDLAVAEVERDHPGQQAVLDRLLDLLLLIALREWLARPDVEPPPGTARWATRSSGPRCACCTMIPPGRGRWPLSRRWRACRGRRSPAGSPSCSANLR